MSALTLLPHGGRLSLRVTPRGGRDGLDGVETLADGRAVLKVRVRAAPADGEANDAVIALVARGFGLNRGDVVIEKGATARLKVLRLHGDPDALAAAYDRVTGAPHDR